LVIWMQRVGALIALKRKKGPLALLKNALK